MELGASKSFRTWVPLRVILAAAFTVAIAWAWISPPGAEADTGAQRASGEQIVREPDGSLTVVWQQEGDSQTRILSSSRPSGGAFGPPSQVMDPSSERSRDLIQFTVGDDGTAAIMLEGRDGPTPTLQVAVRPPGGSFGEPEDIAGFAADERYAGAQLAVSPDGEIVAIWQTATSVPQGMGTTVSAQVVNAAIRPPGGTFTEPVQLSGPGVFTHSRPALAVGPDGTATVVWSRSTAYRTAIEAATRPPSGDFGSPELISDEGHDSFFPQISVEPDGTTTALWQSGGVLSSTRSPGGEFGDPVDISEGDADYGLRIATGIEGTVAAAWGAFDGTDSVIRVVTREPGGSFGLPVEISHPSTDAHAPQLAVSDEGDVSALWYENGAGWSIHATGQSAAGVFDPATSLESTEPALGLEATSQIATGTDGATAIVWGVTRGEDRIVRAAIRAADGTIGEPFDLSTSGPDDPGPGGTTKPEPDKSPCRLRGLVVKSVKRHYGRGTASLEIKAPMAGRITLTGSPVAKRSAKAGGVKRLAVIEVRAKGKAARKLRRTGHVRVRANLRFRPSSKCGTASRRISVRLVKRD